MDSAGASASSAVSVSVGAAAIGIPGTAEAVLMTDTNGNGIPDELEAAAIADGLISLPPPSSLQHLKVKITLDLKKKHRDSIQISVEFNPNHPLGSKTTNLILDVGGVVHSFGTSISKGYSIALSNPKMGRSSKFKAALTNGDFANALNLPRAASGQTFPLTVLLVVGDNFYGSSLTLTSRLSKSHTIAGN